MWPNLRGSYRAYKRKFRESGDLNRLRKVRKRLFFNVNPGGEYVVGTNIKKKGKSKRTFGKKVNDHLYPPFSIIENGQGAVDADSPAQGVGEVVAYGTRAQLQEGLQKVRDIYYNSQMGTHYDNSMPGATQGGFNVSNYRLNIRGMSSKLKLYNSSSATADVEVIVVTPKRLMESALTPLAWWTTCNDNAKAGINSNLPGLNNDFSGGLPITSIFDRPYKLETRTMFARHFKIVDKQKRKMQPGQIWVHNMYHGLKRNMLHDDIMQYTAYPGVTHWYLIIVNGQVINGSAVGPSDIGYSSAQISYVQQMKYTFGYAGLMRRIVMRQNLPTGIPVDNQRFVEDDEIVNDTYREL